MKAAEQLEHGSWVLPQIVAEEPLSTYLMDDYVSSLSSYMWEDTTWQWLVEGSLSQTETEAETARETEDAAGRDGEEAGEEGEESWSYESEIEVGGGDEREERCIRVGTLNVRDGCKGEPERLAEIVAYLQEQALDIIALQELNHWTEDQLRKTAEGWGHSYATLLLTTSGYHLGLTSALPFEVVRKRTEGFHHGLIHVRCADPRVLPEDYNVAADVFLSADASDEDDADDLDEIRMEEGEAALHLLVTHLDPHDAEMRLREAHHVDRLAREHPLLLAFGDFNALSPIDRGFYHKAGLLDKLLDSPELTRKFVYVNEEGEQAIDYRVFDKLYEGGNLYDVTGMEELAEDLFQHTVPTAINEDPFHVAEMRLDYILGTPEMGVGLVEAGVDDSSRTQHLSDHLPVLAQFCFA